MPFVSFTNTCLAEVVFNSNLIVCENTLYFRGDNPWTAGQMYALGAELFAGWQTQIRPLQSDQMLLTVIKLRDMSSQFGAYTEYTPLTGNAGGVSSPALPNNVTAAVKFNTGLVGRRNRGRNFFIGLCENQVSLNQLDSTVAATLAANYGDWLQNLSTNNAVHVIASRATAVGPSWTGVTTPVSSYSVDLKVDTQRRRLS